MSSFAENLFQVQARITAACVAAGRAPGSVQLLAVSKTQSLERLREAIGCGVTAFGENYVQEALPKHSALAGLALTWHHIGPIQSNKTADIATYFDWAHGVDRLKVAERLSAQRPASRSPLQVCVQVNVSGEASKSGCAPAEALALCRAVSTLPGLQLRGLMALPAPLESDAANAATPYLQMQALFIALQSEFAAIDTLSMGMSDDLEPAIAAGSTLLRVGSALFGARAAGKTAIEPAS